MEKSNVFKIPTFLILFSLIILMLYYSNVDFDVDELFKVKKMNEMKNSLNDATTEISKLKKELSEHEDKIKNIKKDIEDLFNDNIETHLGIAQLELVSGATDLRGPGINIRMTDNLTDDPLNINYKIVHDLDVRMIINDLNSAGAEAIAINGKRILSTTEVICIGPVIRINGEAVAAPFIIKAIGDPDILLEKTITSPDSYAYDLKTNYGIDITAIKRNDISISKNKEKFNTKFAKLYEEGE